MFLTPVSIAFYVYCISGAIAVVFLMVIGTGEAPHPDPATQRAFMERLLLGVFLGNPLFWGLLVCSLLSEDDDETP